MEDEAGTPGEGRPAIAMPADVTASALFQDLKLGFSIFYCQNVAQFDGLLAKVRNTSDYVLVNASLVS